MGRLADPGWAGWRIMDEAAAGFGWGGCRILVIGQLGLLDGGAGAGMVENFFRKSS